MLAIALAAFVTIGGVRHHWSSSSPLVEFVTIGRVRHHWRRSSPLGNRKGLPLP